MDFRQAWIGEHLRQDQLDIDEDAAVRLEKAKRPQNRSLLVTQEF